jgi:hypothetical protein
MRPLARDTRQIGDLGNSSCLRPAFTYRLVGAVQSPGRPLVRIIHERAAECQFETVLAA